MEKVRRNLRFGAKFGSDLRPRSTRNLEDSAAAASVFSTNSAAIKPKFFEGESGLLVRRPNVFRRQCKFCVACAHRQRT
ncbi:MAG: hypothetical protein DBX55_06545 [Verrucomicrobia bacterium]|nr:MAG: hypothetical protein DBX55_06545 [Verrucomicrobiota bacterium]